MDSSSAVAEASWVELGAMIVSSLGFFFILTLYEKNVNCILRDKYKDNGIRHKRCNLVKLCTEVMGMSENNPELLNAVYREISEKLGMDTAMEVYQMFKGQQINFPIRFFNPAKIQQIIVREYNGTNIRTLAVKYNYSEKTVRRIIKESMGQE